MRWRKWMRALWPFGGHADLGAADAAVQAAQRSHQRAIQDRCRATATRAEAEAWAAQVRDHNSANRYDDFLRQAMRGDL